MLRVSQRTAPTSRQHKPAKRCPTLRQIEAPTADHQAREAALVILRLAGPWRSVIVARSAQALGGNVDQLPEAIAAVRFWRVLLCVLLGIAIALVASHALSWFTGAAGLALGLVAFAFGLLWQGRAAAGLALFASVGEPPISRPVAALGFAIIGLFWGALLSAFTGSPVMGSLLLAACAFSVALFRATLLKRRPSWAYADFASIALLVGFASTLVLRAASASAL